MLLGLCQFYDSKEKKITQPDQEFLQIRIWWQLNYTYSQEENVRLKLFNVQITVEKHGTQKNQSVF